MVVVVMMLGWWARAAYGVGLTAIILGVWLLMGAVAGATWIVRVLARRRRRCTAGLVPHRV